MNIYDISKASGVSIATVSRVINRSGYVSEKTRRKVQKAIDEYEYIPNAFARGMSRSTMSNIGILSPDSRDPYQADVIYHLQEKLHQAGYSAILCCVHPDLSGCASQISLLLSRNVDAIVCIGSAFASSQPAVREEIGQAARKVPVFILNGSVDSPNVYSIYCDEKDGMKDLTEKVIVSGSRNPVFLMSRKSQSNLAKQAGFEQALAEHQISVSPSRILLSSRSLGAIEKDLDDFFRDHRADAILCADDYLAVLVLHYLLKNRISVPESIQLSGFNGSQISRTSWPEITTCDSQVEFLAQSCVSGIRSVLEKQTFPQKTAYSGSIIERATTRPAAPSVPDQKNSTHLRKGTQ